MRLTSLLDSIPQGGSGPWRPTPGALAPHPADAPAAPPAAPVPTAAPTSGSDAAAFDEILAGLLPCRSHDPELWFAEQQADVERAKALCGRCPLVEGCLAGAVERREPWGVWGGQVFVDGVVVPTKRGRGRPRKNAA